MKFPDSWQMNADPADRLQAIFRPAAFPIRAWKAGGQIKDTLAEAQKTRAAAAGELKSLAMRYGGTLAYSPKFGYSFNFDVAPAGWGEIAGSGGQCGFAPQDRIKRRNIETLSNKIITDGSSGVINLIESHFRDDFTREQQKKILDDNNPYEGYIAGVAPYLWIKSITQIGDDFYLSVDPQTPPLPGCTEMKLSEYFALMESARVTPPRRASAPSGHVPSAP